MLFRSGATVAMYISTVTVARVEIYTFLHNFRSIDVEYFWDKMCKSCVLHDFAFTEVDALSHVYYT